LNSSLFIIEKELLYFQKLGSDLLKLSSYQLREAISGTVQDMLNADLPVSFSKRGFDESG
jgi:hypothetical protein